MSTAEYYEIIISILIGLTLLTIFLLFLYMVYGKEEQESSPARSSSRVYERYLVLNELLLGFLVLVV
jgi:flagellar basal body-associated protein FliL